MFFILIINDFFTNRYTRDMAAVPPRWILEPTDKAFAQGSDARVECKADGFPKPQVTWKKAAGDTPGDYIDLKLNNPDINVEDGTLMINNIQKTNEGYYLCEAFNGIGSGLSAVILVSVQGIFYFIYIITISKKLFEFLFPPETKKINYLLKLFLCNYSTTAL